MNETVELKAEWLRNTAMDVMLATEVEEAIRILTVALFGHFWDAETPFIRYTIEEVSGPDFDSDTTHYEANRGRDCLICTKTVLAEAKAAAQADYEQRILSTLEPRMSPPEPASGWMPIETAPKDGTVLLAITMEAQSPASRISWWDGDGWVRIWKAEKFVMPGPARWWPTHWQPLPTPPAKEPQ